ncbi:hypothetical protein, partial [Plasmodium yoelii yoelii]
LIPILGLIFGHHLLIKNTEWYIY